MEAKDTVSYRILICNICFSNDVIMITMTFYVDEIRFLSNDSHYYSIRHACLLFNLAWLNLTWLALLLSFFNNHVFCCFILCCVMIFDLILPLLIYLALSIIAVILSFVFRIILLIVITLVIRTIHIISTFYIINCVCIIHIIVTTILMSHIICISLLIFSFSLSPLSLFQWWNFLSVFILLYHSFPSWYVKYFNIHISLYYTSLLLRVFSKNDSIAFYYCIFILEWRLSSSPCCS